MLPGPARNVAGLIAFIWLPGPVLVARRSGIVACVAFGSSTILTIPLLLKRSSENR
jgi:hypothetical protein